MTAAAKLAREIMGPDAEKFRYKLKSGRHSGLRINFPDGAEKQAAKFVKPWWRKTHAAGLRLFVGPAQFQLGPGQYSRSWGEVSWDPKEGPPPPQPDFKDAPPSVIPVFALPDIEVLEVLEFAEVGSHNDHWAGIETLAANGEEWARGLVARAKERREEFKKLKITGDTQMEHTHSALARIMRVAPFAIVDADPAGLKAKFLRPVSEKTGALAGELIFAIASESYRAGPEGIADRIIENERFRLWWD